MKVSKREEAAKNRPINSLFVEKFNIDCNSVELKYDRKWLASLATNRSLSGSFAQPHMSRSHLKCQSVF